MPWDDYGDYESASRRKARAKLRILKRRREGDPFVPTICKVGRGCPAKTFWGRAWCQNLESYSDFENRLPRGRTYLRQGSVYDLKVSAGGVFAYVAGSEIYEVHLTVEPLDDERWLTLKQSLAGEVRNLVSLLSGELGESVMQAVTSPEIGLFPAPDQITLNCNCPDWADCCKHVAAVMYAVGVHLDSNPEWLFELRAVDHTELIDTAASHGIDLATKDASASILAADELSELFGIDLADPESAFE